MIKEKLTKIILQEALVDKKSTLKALEHFNLELPIESVYLGTGVSNAKELSIGTPFDILSMILLAEKIRRVLELSKVYHNIADTHAITNEFSIEKVRQTAQQQKHNITSIINAFGFKNYEVILASEFDKTQEYLDILSKIKAKVHDYVLYEITDIEFFRKIKGSGIKIGWAIKSESGTGFDEQFFDKHYENIFGRKILFVYSNAGKRLDDKAPNAAPYILTPSELDTRIAFLEGINTGKKLANASCQKNTLQAARNHLCSILRLYQELVEPLTGSVGEKTDYIIKKVISGGSKK